VSDASPQRIVDSIMANNQPPIPTDKVLGFPSRRAAEEYLAAHPDGALGALHFYRSGERAMSYIVQANTTVRSSSSSSVAALLAAAAAWFVGASVRLASSQRVCGRTAAVTTCLAVYQAGCYGCTDGCCAVLMSSYSYFDLPGCAICLPVVLFLQVKGLELFAAQQDVAAI
jgi:hypothetical protein